MSILSFVKRVCVQDAVYWAPPVNDGFNNAYPTPVAIKCRWEGTDKMVTTDMGRQYICAFEIISPTECKVGGLLGLIDLDTLSVDQKANPKNYPEFPEIKKVDKTPLFRSTNKFVYTYYT